MSWPGLTEVWLNDLFPNKKLGKKEKTFKSNKINILHEKIKKLEYNIEAMQEYIEWLENNAPYCLLSGYFSTDNSTTKLRRWYLSGHGTPGKDTPTFKTTGEALRLGFSEWKRIKEIE